MEEKPKFSWEYNQVKFPIDTSKNPLPIFYDFYDPSKDFQNVYEPSEDSFLLIDSLDKELEEIKFDKNKKITSVELGCGNGLVSCCYLSKLKELNIKLINHFCIDINKDAIILTEKLLKNYHLDNDVFFIEGDLFNNIEKNILFDIIIFNPPYVTTSKEEYERSLIKKDIYAAWAGGKKGSETINKFVEDLKGHINEKTIIFLLLSKENDYETIIEKMNKLYKKECEILMRKRFKNERLAIFKFFTKT